VLYPIVGWVIIPIMKSSPEKRREPRESNPNSPFPSDMLGVAIPAGTVMDVREIRDQQAHREFGVTQMMHGMVSSSSGKHIEGTVLWFNGNTFRVDVGRRDLTAEEINNIAKLSVDLDQIITVLGSLPKQIVSAEKLIHDLTVSKDIFKNRSNFDAAQAISELGILISKMRPALVEQQDQWRKTISELASLGVTQIHDQGGGPLGGVPIAKMAGKFGAEAQKA